MEVLRVEVRGAPGPAHGEGAGEDGGGRGRVAAPPVEVDRRVRLRHRGPRELVGREVGPVEPVAWCAVQGSGCTAQGSGHTSPLPGAGCRVQGASPRCLVQGSGCRVQGAGLTLDVRGLHHQVVLPRLGDDVLCLVLAVHVEHLAAEFV